MSTGPSSERGWPARPLTPTSPGRSPPPSMWTWTVSPFLHFPICSKFRGLEVLGGYYWWLPQKEVDLTRPVTITVDVDMNCKSFFLTLKYAGFWEVFFWRNEVCLIKFSFKWKCKYFIWKLRCSANFWHLDQCFQWVQHIHLSAACLGASIWSLNFSYSRSAKLKHFSVFFNVVYGCFHHFSNYFKWVFYSNDQRDNENDCL